MYQDPPDPVPNPGDEAARSNAANRDDDLDDSLDAGLVAAFGGGAGMSSWGASALATLDVAVGNCSRVLLHEDAVSGPIIRPSGREGVAPETSRYQVAGEIARGGVGVILKGRDVDLGRDVAMKVLRPDHAGKPSLVRRFVEEAQIAGQLQHPGILPVYELGLDEANAPYFTMKLVRGKTLSALLAERADVDDDRVRFLRIFESICQTLAYAHAKGVIHRDLKPSNVMVGPFGEVHVVDWGLAKVLTHGRVSEEDLPSALDEAAVETVRSGSEEQASRVGSVMGTPAFMAPEQARGEVGELDERVDVFALGALLCEVLTGKPAFRGDRDEVLEQARAGDLGAAEADLGRVEVDSELRQLALDCLSADKKERPRHGGVVADRMGRYLVSVEERAQQAEIDSARSSARAEQEHRARRLTVALASAVLILVTVVGVGGWSLERRSTLETQRHSNELQVAMAVAGEELARAASAPVGEKGPWNTARTSVEQVERMTEADRADAETRELAFAFLERFATADRDRQLIETIEDVVIAGATHSDAKSWTRMEEELRNAFSNYGIDLLEESNADIAEKIAASPLSSQIADGFELWIATCANLGTYGVQIYPMSELIGRLEVLYEVDKDPFATGVRRLLYSTAPTSAEVDGLLESVDLEDVRPRTLSWLGAICYRTGDSSKLHQIYRDALMIYPDDFMLNFDYAYQLVPQEKWQEATRYYMRCLAIRPNSSGVWRSLGNALREVRELDGSADALVRSIELQPDHAPTHVDLARTRERQLRYEEARSAVERALEIDPDSKVAKETLESLKGKGGE